MPDVAPAAPSPSKPMSFASLAPPAGARYAAIALVSCAVLIYEVAITRVLSVVLWYHFAFLAISLAMLGIGAPGVWFSLRRPRDATLPRCLAAAGFVTPLSVAVIAHAGTVLPRVDEELPILGPTQHGDLLLTGVVVLAVLVPLLLLGSAICLLLLEAPGRHVARMYGLDLVGAAAGAALVVPLMRVVPTPTLVSALGLLPVLAWGLVRPRGRRFLPVLSCGLILLVLAWGRPFRLSYSKVYLEEDLNLLYEKWTPTARLTVFSGLFWHPSPDRAFGWGFGSRFDGEEIEQLWLEQDGSAGTPITKFEGGVEALSYLDFDVTSVGYQFRRPQRVCIIGAGGGRDILMALRAKATTVDAVELNPNIIQAVTREFGDFSGDVYELPGVRAHAAEGRSFLTRASDRYDLIQISLIDSWAATAAGAFALSENYLYTVEAFRLYWTRLSEAGVLSVSRWIRGDRQLESARLVLLAEKALAEEGVREPRRHMAVLRGGNVATLLVSPVPFGTAGLARLDAIARRRGFERVWPPADLSTATDSLVAEVLLDGTERLDAAGIHLDAPTDDRPFFFQNLGLLDVSKRPSDVSVNDQAVVLLRFLLVFMTLLTLGLFFAPLAARGGMKLEPGFWRGSLYFAAIGLGFMLVEAPWIQESILYLGHPSYATTVLLASLLVASGIGSMVAGSASSSRVYRWRWLLPLTVLACQWAQTPLFGLTIGASFAARVAVTVALTAPAGFVMGFAFPSGLIAFGDGNKAWFWAINGAAGVLSTVASLAVAMTWGFEAVVWTGSAAYLAACALAPRPGLRWEARSP